MSGESENNLSLSNDFKRQNTTSTTPNFSHSDFVSIKFVNQENKETFFRVRRNVKLGKAFAAYSEHHKLDYPVDFIFNGERVNHNFTSDDIDIEDGDELEVYKHVHGGRNNFVGVV